MSAFDLSAPEFKISFREPTNVVSVGYYGLPSTGFAFLFLDRPDLREADCTDDERAEILFFCREEYHRRLALWRGEKVALRIRKRGVSVGYGDAA